MPVEDDILSQYAPTSGDGDPFAMSPAPPAGWRGYDYTPETTPYQAFVRPLASSEMAKREPNWFGRNVLRPASEIPGLMEVAGFIGPKGAANLSKARLRHADDWGGINRLSAAQEHPQWGMPDIPAMREIWKHFGWSPPNTFGAHGMAKKGAQPMTAIATPEFAVNEGRLQDMQMGNQTVRRGQGTVPELLHGVDEMLVAEPSLRTLPLELTMDPSLRIEPGVTSVAPIWPGGAKRIGAEPEGWRVSGVKAGGYDIPSLTGTAAHEVKGHALAIPQGITPTMGEHQKMHPIRGTAAEQRLLQTIAELQNEFRRPGLSEAEVADLTRQITRAKDLLDQTPGDAGYFNLAEERMARTAKALGNKPLAEIKKETPAAFDTYKRGAFAPGIEKHTYPFPLEDYRPPWMADPKAP